MEKLFRNLTFKELKHINGGIRWGGPITAFMYELIDVWTSSGENLKQAWENGRNAGCQGECGE